jgi:hypothetical protein
MGIERTYSKIAESYYWPGMMQSIENYVKTCDMCHRIKPTRRKQQGHLQPIEIPTKPWEVIQWDFIQSLPLSENYHGTTFNEILVITDKLTKQIELVPWHSTYTTEELAIMFLERIYAKHGMPKSFISDRDTLFDNQFWDTFTRKLGSYTRIASTGHAQTDGQTERYNATLEAYLRAYINYDQDNWVEYLPLAEYAYNSSKHSSTKTTPFEANIGYTPAPYGEATNPKKLDNKADKRTSRVKKLQEQLRKDLIFLQSRMEYYYNKKRRKEIPLKEGDTVYLLRQGRTKRTGKNEKLDYKREGPYTIIEKLSDVSYKLKLPPHSRQHPVFHISLLLKAPEGLREPPETDSETDPDQEPQEHQIEDDPAEGYDPEDHDSQAEYGEVERILNHDKDEDGNPIYLIKWKGFSNKYNDWEPAENIPEQLRNEYHRNQRTKRRATTQKPEHR